MYTYKTYFNLMCVWLCSCLHFAVIVLVHQFIWWMWNGAKQLQTLNQANTLCLSMSLTVGCYHLHPPSPLVIIQLSPFIIINQSVVIINPCDNKFYCHYMEGRWMIGYAASVLGCNSHCPRIQSSDLTHHSKALDHSHLLTCHIHRLCMLYLVHCFVSSVL